MASASMHKSDKDIAFGLIFFSSSETPFSGDKYRLVIESARFADQHGFSSIWIPERHFTKDGWLYPNPAVLQAALARETRHIHLRAGSVVMPLHNPIRVAEEWAMVDNLSGGRVGISFASGWHPNDFAFFPENYSNRHEIMYQGIQTVQKLWRGESVQIKGGDGRLVEIRTYPTPIQHELPIWITAAGNPKTFSGAGEIGANLLTHMYNQSVEELAEKIHVYRDAREKHGYDPQTGQVSVMLHTFIWEKPDEVYEQAKASFREYLKSASYLLNAVAYSRGQKVDLANLSEQDVNDYLQFVFDRLISTQRVLFGTPEGCLNLVTQLRAAGVNEIACQMDFGIDIDIVLRSMPYLNQLKEQGNAEMLEKPSPILVSIQEEHTSSNNGSNGHAASLTPSPPEIPVSQTGHEQGVPLQDIRRRCKEELSIVEFYKRLHEHGIQLAASFQGIQQLWRRDGEAVGLVQLPHSLQREAGAYQVHPTLLDACFQVLIAALPYSGSGSIIDQGTINRGAINRAPTDALYLPTRLRSFRVNSRPGNRVWSHALLTSATKSEDGLFEGDVRVLDDAGQVLVEAVGLQLQRSEPERSELQPYEHQEQLNDWLYEPRWEPKQLEVSQHPLNGQSGRWLIYMDTSGVGLRIAELLTAQGDTCIKVFSSYTYQVLERDHYRINPSNPEHVRRLINDVLGSETPPCRGVIHLWSLDMTPLAETSISSMESNQALGVGNALYLLQTLIARNSIEPPRLWFVTGGTQHVDSERSPLSLAQSPLWGLGKTCAIEHPELWGGLVDIDPHEQAETTATQLVRAISNQESEDQIAFRRGQSYVARLIRSRDWSQQKLELRRDASYLITGGLWGLGFEVARWLAQQGAGHLVLLGRTQLPSRSDWDRIAEGSRLARQIASMRELEGLGVDVHYAPVDVADEEQMTTFVQDLYRQGYPAIRGIVHAASVWQDQQGQSLVRPLANLTEASLKDVFRPKVVGGWLLYKLFVANQQTPLDFFVSFSSGASLFGSAAQGNYAAAGAFLDALAHHMRAEGHPALSIDWGAVSETGFGATAEGQRVHEYWESHGIYRITPKQVLAAFELLTPQKAAQVGVLKLDWHQLQQFYPQLDHLPFVTYMRPEMTSLETGLIAPEVIAPRAFLQTLLEANLEERQRLLESYLCEQVAGVLRIPISKLDIHQPLTALGLDSLMAIELKNRIEHELRLRISIITFLQGPSIYQFTSQLLDQLSEAMPMQPTKIRDSQQPEAHGAAVNQDEAEHLLGQLDQLSDDEVNSLLTSMLEQES